MRELQRIRSQRTAVCEDVHSCAVEERRGRRSACLPTLPFSQPQMCNAGPGCTFNAVCPLPVVRVPTHPFTSMPILLLHISPQSTKDTYDRGAHRRRPCIDVIAGPEAP